MLLVGLDARTAATLGVIAELHGHEPHTVATAEAALERSASHLVTSLRLPGLSGAELTQRFDGRVAILDNTRPALPASVQPDRVVTLRDGWVQQIDAWLATPRLELTALRRAVLSADAEALATRGDAMGLTFLANAFPAETVVPLLERAVVAAEADARVYGLVLDLAIAQGRAGLPLVETLATSDGPPTLRGKAMRHLAAHLEPSLTIGLCAEAMQAPSAMVRLEAAHAALECAAEHGVLEALVELASSSAIDVEVRARALDRLARDWPADRVSALLARLIGDAAPRVAQAASAALVRIDGIDADTLERAAQHGTFASRRAAMLQIAEDLPWRAALGALERQQVDEDFEVRRVAYELATSVAVEGFEDTVTRAIADGAERSVLLGALKLGRRGAATLTHLATSSATKPIRIAAIRALGSRFSDGALSTLQSLWSGDDPEIAGAALLAALHARGGSVALRGAAAHAPREDVRVRALDLLDDTGEEAVARDAVQRALRDDDRSVRIAATRIAMRRAGAECAELLDRVAKTHDEAIEDAALDGAIALGLAGYGAAGAIAYDARLSTPVRLRAVRWIERTFDHEDRAELFVALEAASPGLVDRARRETTDAEPPARATDLAPTFWTDVTQPEAPAAFDVADTAPVAPATESPSAEVEPQVAALVRPAPRARRPSLGLDRARAALQVALRAGANGHRGLMTLASSSRVPSEVRIQALRHLAASTPERGDVGRLLEAAMRSDDPALQDEALRAAVVRRDPEVEAIRYVAEKATSPETRARATRFLGSHWPVREVRAALEARLYDEHASVRLAALFAVFSSTRFVAEHRREEALINILVEHADPEVRESAAHALGAFGTEASLSPLRKLSCSAARVAEQRIRERIESRRG